MAGRPQLQDPAAKRRKMWLSLPPATIDALEAEAARLAVSKSEIVRLAVSAWMKKARKV